MCLQYWFGREARERGEDKVKSNYPRPTNPADEPKYGRPSYALAIAFCVLICIGYMANSVWPQWLKDACDSWPIFYYAPLVPALALQSSIRGLGPKLITVLVGYIVSFAMLWCAGILSMLGGD